MTVSTILALLRRAKRKGMRPASVSMTVFRDDGSVPVRITYGH